MTNFVFIHSLKQELKNGTKSVVVKIDFKVNFDVSFNFFWYYFQELLETYVDADDSDELEVSKTYYFQ